MDNDIFISSDSNITFTVLIFYGILVIKDPDLEVERKSVDLDSIIKNK